MRLTEFYRKYAELSKPSRFEAVHLAQVKSAFMIYKELEGVRAQLRYYQLRQEELLAQADLIFNKDE